MQLWTEYEGRKIAGTYTLGKLLRSEGRNGFFATADTTGHAAVIRLTEAHYDEDELLKRWQQVAGMHQDNLIEIERFGQTNLEGIAITYALMEANDANLGDVLSERPLTLTESLQVAKAVHAALSLLHANGLVHEHIEPVNVLAVGETVKLRSDCVRECVADIEFNTPEGCAKLRRRDIHDFGMLLVQCLTLEKRYNPGLNLPDIFRRLIPHMLDGTWTLEQIGQLVNPPAAPAPLVPPSTAARAVPAKSSGAQAASPRGGIATPPEQGTLPLTPETTGAAADTTMRYRREVPDEPGTFALRPWVLGGFAGVVLCIILLWHFVHSKPVHPATAVHSSPGFSSAAPQPVTPPAASPALRSQAAPPALAAHAPGWYVISWTYGHQSQAQAMADRINAKYRGFHAEVFSPHRGGAFLVSLGGPMSEPEAKALQQRARHSGLPRDTYISRYR